MYKKQKDVIEAKKEINLADYHKEKILLQNLLRASKSFGQPQMTGVTNSGLPTIKILTIDEIIIEHGLQQLLVVLKNMGESH
jgi:hypothetical protein